MDKQHPTNKTLPERLGNGMLVATWIMALGIFTWYFSGYLERQQNPNQEVTSYEQHDSHEVILQRNRFGHYVATGKINGMTVDFMLDTGASIVSIPSHVANRLHLQTGPALEVVTANGTIEVYATILDEVRLGNILLKDVKASINPYMQEDEILLGMSFLKRLDFSQQGDQLTLIQYR